MTDMYSDGDQELFGKKCAEYLAGRNLSAMLPGSDVYLFLAQIADPKEVEWFEWRPDNLNDRHRRTGQILLVTARSVTEVRYENAIDEKNGPHDPRGQYTAGATVRMRDELRRIEWSPAEPGGNLDALDAGTVRLAANDWGLSLPYLPLTSGGAGYVRKLRDRFGF